MRSWLWLALMGTWACSSEELGVIDHGSTTTTEPDAGTARETDASTAPDALPPSDASSDASQTPTGPCPAPALASTEKELFGDAVVSGWSVSGFHRDVALGAPACSGAASVGYTSHQYDGIGFHANDDGNEVDAQTLRFRIHVDRDAIVSAAAAPRNPPNDIHQYFLSPQSQWAWKKGWNTAEFAIPSSYGKTGQILFEVQSCSAPACDDSVSIDFRVDDLRLVPR